MFISIKLFVESADNDLCYSVIMFKWLTFLSLLMILTVPSCAKLQYLDQALELKAYDDEKTAQGLEVERRDAQFDALVIGVRTGQVQASVRTAADLERQYGAPVLKKTDRAGQDRGCEWLYRYQVKRHSPKVYVIVLEDGRIDGFRLEE